MGRRALRVLCLLWLAPASAGADTLTLPPDPAPWVAALPVVTGDTSAAARINAALAEIDRSQQFAMTCEGLDPEGAFRTVDILSDGPAFLSLFVTIAGACEGASYPWSEHLALTFDLATGAPADLAAFLPPGWRDRGPELFTLYLAHADLAAFEDDCLDVLTLSAEYGRLSYLFGVDSAAQRLVIRPTGLLPIEAGCEQPARVPADALRAAGFGPALVAAVQGRP